MRMPGRILTPVPLMIIPIGALNDVYVDIGMARDRLHSCKMVWPHARPVKRNPKSSSHSIRSHRAGQQIWPTGSTPCTQANPTGGNDSKPIPVEGNGSIARTPGVLESVLYSGHWFK